MSRHRYFKWVLVLSWMIILITCSVSAQENRGFFRDLLLKRIEKKTDELTVDAQRGALTHAGKRRSYYLHIPRSWDRQTPLPLVFLFHGGGGNAKQALDNYGLIPKSDEAGFLLVAPNGVGPADEALLTWNVGFGFGEAQKCKSDDVGFISALIEKLEKQFPIDPCRIFATGMSNGAFFCHLLAAQPGNRFAAIAPVVGSIGGKELKDSSMFLPPKPTTPVSVMAINGLLDEHVPLEGGLQKKSIQEARIMTSASQTMRFWTEADQCASTPISYYDEKLKTSVFQYLHGRADTEVILYVLHNQGHAWPGAHKTPRSVADKPSPDFPGNDLIWEFFQAHPRSKIVDEK